MVQGAFWLSPSHHVPEHLRWSMYQWRNYYLRNIHHVPLSPWLQLWQVFSCYRPLQQDWHLWFQLAKELSKQYCHMETCWCCFTAANTQTQSQIKPTSLLAFMLSGSRPQHCQYDKVLLVSIQELTYETVLDLSLLNEHVSSNNNNKKKVSHRVTERAHY